MVVNEAVLDFINRKMPWDYAAMSPGEFFAELYAVYYRPDSAYRLYIEPGIAQWFDANVGRVETDAPLPPAGRSGEGSAREVPIDNFTLAAVNGLEKLRQLPTEEDLYAEIGRRLMVIRQDPVQAGEFSPSAPFVPAATPVPAMTELGRAFFKRVNHDAYSLICGSGAGDLEDRNKVLTAFGIGESAVTAALCAAFVSTFGWAPAIAAAVAALVVRLFYKDAYPAMCEVWKSHSGGC